MKILLKIVAAIMGVYLIGCGLYFLFMSSKQLAGLDFISFSGAILLGILFLMYSFGKIGNKSV